MIDTLKEDIVSLVICQYFLLFEEKLSLNNCNATISFFSRPLYYDFSFNV